MHSTGYVKMREVNAALFGKHIIDQTDEVYGLDEEGELRGSYRPSGYPGVSVLRVTIFQMPKANSQLWFASGAFNVCRSMSKPLVSSTLELFCSPF